MIFFRKYQKVVLVIVAVFTTASFIFFGSYSVLQSPNKIHDFAIGKTIDGKNVTSQQLQLLIRFLNTSPNERQLFEKGGTPNLLNDGVVQKDFFETGFITLLGERFFEHFKDPFLEKGDLSLFGFNTLEDWLGKRCLTLIAETLLNGAAMAKKEGYTVSLSEARASLKENLREALTKISDRELSAKEIEKMYYQQVSQLFWNEEKVVEVWAKVLIFRKFFRDFGQHMIVDKDTLEKPDRFALEMVTVDLFRLPSELELKNFRDLLKLQIYLGAVSSAQVKKSKLLLLSLPLLFASPKDIEREYPELVETKYDVKVQEVSLNALTEKVSLKEAYNWELSEQHWDELKDLFPILKGQPSNTVEDRHRALTEIPLRTRAEIDFFAKKKIVQDQPEWLELAFADMPKKPLVFGFRLRGGDLPFKGSVDHEELRESLKKTPIGSVLSYTADREHYYRIELCSSPSTPEIVQFGEARNDGTLDLLLDRYLSQIYPEVRKKHPALFAKKEGGFKPLKEVQDLVGAEAFAEVLHSIEEESRQYGVVWTDQMKHSLDLFARYRLISHLQQVRDALSNGIADEGFIRGPSPFKGLSTISWGLIKEEKVFKRKEAKSQNLEKIFEEKEDFWSQIQVNVNKGPYFYHIKQKQQQASNIESIRKQREELLSLDIQRTVFTELLEKMSSNGLMIDSEDFQKGLEEGA